MSVRAEVERKTKKLILEAEMELRAAQTRFNKAKDEFDAATRRLDAANTQLAAMQAIEQACTKHLVLQDLKEGHLED